MILDTLSNGLKDLFAALGAKTSDSNYAVPLLNKTNGTPQGMMDMASLASVLGGLLKCQSVRGFQGNCNDLDTGFAYYFEGGSNAPSIYCWIITLKYNSSDCAQLAWGSTGLWTRRKSTNTWSSWSSYQKA